MEKFHMGRPRTIRFARWKRPINSRMRFHVCDSASVIGWCLMALYFAPMDAASNSGRFSSQTFRTSSSIAGRTFLEAERKALVRAIEFDLSPRGDDWICRTFIVSPSKRTWNIAHGLGSIAARQVGVGVDAAVAQEGPVAADLLDFGEVAFRDQSFLGGGARARDYLAEWIGDE